MARLARRLLQSLILGVVAALSFGAIQSYAVDPYRDVSRDARTGLQWALLWTGDYNGSVDGDLGPGSIAAIRSFQRRHGWAASGILTLNQVDALAAEAVGRRDSAGFVERWDSAAKIYVGIPVGWVPLISTTKRGTRYANADGTLAIETARLPADVTTLSTLYKTLSSPTRQRRVEYSVLRSDWFAISGREGERVYFVRFHELLGGELIGISVSRAADAMSVDNIDAIISNSFVAFSQSAGVTVRTAIAPAHLDPSKPFGGGVDWIIVASRGEAWEAIGLARTYVDRFPNTFVAKAENGRYAVSIGKAPREGWPNVRRGLVTAGFVPADTFRMTSTRLVEVVWIPMPAPSTVVPPVAEVAKTPEPENEATPAPEGRRPIASGTGFLINRIGQVLTNNHVIDGCSRPGVAGFGEAKLIVSDPENDLAILQTAEPIPREPLRFAPRGAAHGATVYALGFPLQSILASSVNITAGMVSSIAGINDDSRMLQVTAAVQPGNSGGPLLNDRGQLVGIVTSKLDAIRMAALTGDVPQSVNFAIRKEVVEIFLSARAIGYMIGDEGAEQLTSEVIAAVATPPTLPVVCMDGS